MNSAVPLTDEELDVTMRNSEALIAQNEKLLLEAEASLQRSKEVLGEDLEVVSEAVQTFIAAQPEEVRAEFEREVQAIHDEIERDLPKHEEIPTVRMRLDRVRV
jgi:hypothetical protein